MSLERFVAAQDRIWPAPLTELTAGRKETHWMWFVFPQLRALGRSATAQHYGIADLAEARTYLSHPVLGPRLHEAAQAVLLHRDRQAAEVMGGVDAMKLRSSATLFSAAGGGEDFNAVIAAFFNGPDPETLRILGESGSP